MRPPSKALPFWPADQLDAALAAVSSVLPVTSAAHSQPLLTESIEIPWPALRRALPALAPAVLTTGGNLVILAASRLRGVLLAHPSGSLHRLTCSRFARCLREAAVTPAAPGVDALLSSPLLGRLRPAARRRARHALLDANVAATPGSVCHFVDAAIGAPRDCSTFHRFRHRGLRSPLLSSAVTLAAAILTSQALSWLGWLVLGGAVLRGQLDIAAAATLALLWFSIPLARAIEVTCSEALACRLALRIRRRLFEATLATAPASRGGEGTGRLLSTLLAAESCESGLATGLPAACLALVELVGATLALEHGAARAPHLLLLAAVLGATAPLALSYLRWGRAAAAHHHFLTGRLIEALAGHRTLAAQAATSSSNVLTPGTDELPLHHRLLCKIGSHEVHLCATLPRAWLLAGLTTLALPHASGASPEALALSLGGLLLAQAALARLAGALRHLLAAATAWRQFQVLRSPAPETPVISGPPGATASLPAIAFPSPTGPPSTAPQRSFHHSAARAIGAATPPLLLEAHLTHRHPATPPCFPPLLDHISLSVRSRDRILLTGPSGAGKSTLAALLAAHRPAAFGVLLLHGLDIPTLGTAAWRRRVVTVPQLHANHLFAGSLAWNLLLGRAWPPAPADLAAAAEVCYALGLRDLLDRLPGGLDQPVGEAGWQLSDGEAARVCLARALLQESHLLTLDESLGALDPTLRLRVLTALDARCRALLIVAHADDPPVRLNGGPPIRLP